MTPFGSSGPNRETPADPRPRLTVCLPKGALPLRAEDLIELAVGNVTVRLSAEDAAGLSQGDACALEIRPIESDVGVPAHGVVAAVASLQDDLVTVTFVLDGLADLFGRLDGELRSILNRRREFRVTPSIKLDVISQVKVARKQRTVLTHDINSDGVGLSLPGSLLTTFQPGGTIAVRVSLAANGGTFQMAGEVVHVTPDEENTAETRCGVRFVERRCKNFGAFQRAISEFALARQREDRKSQMDLEP